MKERPKLGRGLQDVSSYFLSRAARTGQVEGQPLKMAENTRTVCVCCPGSSLTQSSIISNIALELARNRYAVTIKDFSMDPELSVSNLMSSILSEDEAGQGVSRARLYGLPDILIQQRNKEDIPELSGLEPGLAADKDKPLPGVVLVNPLPGLDFHLEAEAAHEYVLVTKTDEHSLLGCYAYMRVIRSRSLMARVHVVFDNTDHAHGSDDVFGKLARFVQENLGLAIDFLGSLLRDDQYDRSIADKKPLVLSSGKSEAKETLLRICSLLLEGLNDQRRSPEP